VGVVSQVRTSREVDGRLAARLVAFVGVLLGLIAMHGLGDRGAVSHELHTAATAPALAAAHPAHAKSEASPEAGDKSPAAASAAAPDSPTPGTWMAGLCLSVLAGAIIGFLLTRPHRRLVFRGSLALDSLVARPSGRLDRDPPCLFELSVMRI
jgi:hypothetical protein